MRSDRYVSAPRNHRGRRGSPCGLLLLVLLIGLLAGAVAFLAARAWLAPTPSTSAAPVSMSSPMPPARPSPENNVLPENQSGDSPAPVPTSIPHGIPANTATAAPAAGSALTHPNFATLQQLMLDLINRDRAAAGLDPVLWDQTAARAAQDHAEDMAGSGYMSHWDLDGYGPSYRYSQAGGLDAVQENVYMYWYRYDDGRPAPIDDWETVIREAQANLMDSPGHQANILTPEHTHVGLGLAYNSETGDVRLAQLFVNHYLQLTPFPIQASVGQQISLQGRLEPGSSGPLLNLAYEPFPRPLSVDELNQTGAYNSPAEIYDAANLPADENGRFQQDVVLDNAGRPGLYYVRIWVKSEFGDILANEIVIEVR